MNRKSTKNLLNSTPRIRKLDSTAIALLLVFTAGCAILLIIFFTRPTSIEIFHLLDHYEPRDGSLTVNITGAIIGPKSSVKYRLNKGEWLTIPQGGPRVPPPNFTIEIDPLQLEQGENCLSFSTDQVTSPRANSDTCFTYGQRPNTHGQLFDRENLIMEAQDGRWETALHNQHSVIRPKPGFEGYDRILIVSPAFKGSRRVSATMTFRHNTDGSKPFGFGILPLWGGHPDDSGHHPRRGWIYGLSWYYSAQKGVGVEVATKQADQPFKQVYSYRSYSITTNKSYRLITEALLVQNDSERPHYIVRMKWWAKGETVPKAWLQIIDTAGNPLPDQAYAVALLAHRTQVDFSDITVKALP